MSDFFNDMPEEATAEGEALAEEQLQEFEQTVTADDLAQEDVSSVLEHILTEDEQDTLDDARKRLDQAKLYETIMQNNIFEGINANPRAVLEVQEELKNFAMERLQTLLGMKAPKSAAPAQQVVQTPPQFNDIEVMALRDIAAKLTKNASLAAGEPQQKLKPLQQQAQPPKQAQPLKSAAPKPMVRQRPEVTVTPEDRPALTKKPTEMNREELMERNRLIQNKKRGTSARAMPMPDADQKQMIHMKTNMSGNEGSAIAGLLAKMGKIDMVPVEDVGGGSDSEDINSRM
jgi:hypothetical protein